jgi:hypothetical protein
MASLSITVLIDFALVGLIYGFDRIALDCPGRLFASALIALALGEG